MVAVVKAGAGDADDDEDAGEDAPRRKRVPVWKLGINDKTKGPDALPPAFQSTGTLRGDYVQVMRSIGAVPHPGFKPRSALKAGMRMRPSAPQLTEEKPEEELSVFTIHSMRMDRLSCHVVGLCLLEARQLRVLRFIDCRLDPQMIKLLRRGFTGQCSVECLQLDWNPLDEATLSSQRLVSARVDTPEEQADEAGMALAELLDGACLLEALSLRACMLSGPEVEPIAAALKQCPWQLRQLNLWENRIDDRVAEALANALLGYRGLEFLGLGHNLLTDEGLFKLCRAYNIEVLSDPTEARGKVQQQTEKRDAAAKAKAKAAPAKGGRALRQQHFLVDELEEHQSSADGGGPVWFYRKATELKCLSFAENHIKRLSTLERLQPLGPGRAELVVLGTPAAAALLAKYPDLSTREKKAFCFPSGGADVPSGPSDGWMLRLA